MKTQELFTKLQKAKENVRWLLDNEAGIVDFHDLAYWAQVVVNLRKEIKNSL